MTVSISPSEARRLILACQGLSSRRNFGSGLGATQKAIEHLGYVQIDTLSVVARAHIHTLWNRVATFRANHIDTLQEQGAVYEHWAHALAILPMSDYRYSLPMMQRIASGDTHWYPKDRKDFKDKKSSDAMWARSPSKIALEQLFMEGELMVPRRINLHKVYDLRERVLPSDTDVSMPTQDELCRHLATSYLRAQGLAQVTELAYLRKGLGRQMAQTAADMVEEGVLQEVAVGGVSYYTTPEVLATLDRQSPSTRLRILSPFDNAVIQRKRLASLFNFDYQIECYVPKAKRKYGYFCLPILEDSVKNPEAFLAALTPELERFAKFDGCTSVEIHSIRPAE